MRQRDMILEALLAFRAMSASITLTDIIAFLYVSENEGLSMQELAILAGLTEPTASRAIRTFAAPDSPWSLPPALGLVEAFADTDDRRRRHIYLTEKGAAFVDRLEAIIAAAVPIQRAARRPSCAPDAVAPV